MTNLFTYLSNWRLKYICALFVLLCAGVGQMWGTTTTVTTTSGTSWTVDGRTWTAATDVENVTGSKPYLAMKSNSSNITVGSTMSMDLSGIKTVTVTVGAGYYGGSQASVTAKLVNSSGTVISNVGSATPSTNGNKSYTITLTPTDRTVTDAKVIIGVSNATANSKYIRLYSFAIEYTGKPLITVSPTSITGLDYDYGSGPSTAQTFSVSGVELSANITVTAPTNFEVCTTSGGTYTSSVTLTRSGTSVSSTTIYVRLASGKAVGSYGGASTYVTATSTNATTKNVSVSGTVSSTTFTVTYNGNGKTGGDVPTDATEYSSGETVTVKGNTGSLVKTGYAFGGWNTQTDGKGTNYTAGSGTFTITANTTLYAKWIPTYTVTYDDNDATSGSVPTDATVYNSGTTVTVKGNTGSLVKTGWTFAGWNTNATGTGTNYVAGSGTFEISANTTLYAKWTCTVTWSVNGATNVYDAQTLIYNATSSKVGSVPDGSDLDLDNDYCGDKFMGWTSDESYVHGTSNLFTDVSGSPELKAVGNTTFYAVFADYAD